MFRTKERREDPVTLLSGRPARLGSHHGLVHGDREGQDGTLSVQLWHGEWPEGGVSVGVTLCLSIVIFLEKELTFTQEEWISSSLTMTTRLPRQR